MLKSRELGGHEIDVEGNFETVLEMSRALDTTTLMHIFFVIWAARRITLVFQSIILLHEKFLQFDWLRAVVFQLNLKYLHVKITKPLRVVV